MQKLILKFVTLSIIATSSMAIAAPTAPLSTPALKQNVGKTGKPTLIFFQNPYGGPCKAQKVQLDQLTAKRKDFGIVPINAMDQNDQKAFYDYGVRSLPSLVLVDKTGKISKVFPPGIQSVDSISAALNGLK